ncbi:9691_t:CDS:1 [Cetraspora pellucida]|uniref:9691_t:CDS:1 n=1 Tax=Cetraspora pellucida TaxID=1433469 RepID=A0A9N9PDU2_9GLOM|nr:9691_t:CDS:1 [Cetraspora pellucida]
MSQSKPVSTNGNNNPPPPLPIIRVSKIYGYLTLVQVGTAAVFTTFLVTHLSATALATLGGIELTNKTIVLGRVYYQNRFLEPIIVAGSFWGHILSGLIKRGIKLYWKYKKQDTRNLAGEAHEKVEMIVTDGPNEQGVVVRKTMKKTTTTITGSYISRAIVLLLPYHHLAGYLLIPFVLSHAFIHRVLPRRHFGDSSMINASYVTLALKKWPRSTYLTFTMLIGLGVYHVCSGAPVVYKILRGSIIKNSDKPTSEATKKRLRIIRNGVIVSSIGLLATGLLVIGGKLRRENIKIPLRPEYLKVYGHVYPQSWVRY